MFRGVSGRTGRYRCLVCSETGKTELTLILREANRWVECYVMTFCDVSKQEGKSRILHHIQSKWRVVNIGFHSQAADCIECRISFDEALLTRLRAGHMSCRYGIIYGILLVDDNLLTASDDFFSCSA